MDAWLHTRTTVLALRITALLTCLALVATTAGAAPLEPKGARLDATLRLAAARGQLGPALASLTSAGEVGGSPAVEVVILADSNIGPELKAIGADVRTVLDDGRPVGAGRYEFDAYYAEPDDALN